MTIRVLLVDDHAVVRSGLRRVLEAEDDIEVVAEAGDMRNAVFEARAHKPDVIVMDVVMPDASGIEAPIGRPDREPGALLAAARPGMRPQAIVETVVRALVEQIQVLLVQGAHRPSCLRKASTRRRVAVSSGSAENSSNEQGWNPHRLL